MIDRVTDLIGAYERWVLAIGTRPTVTLFAAIFALLVVVTLPAYRRLSWSMRACVWFFIINVAAWLYLRDGTKLSRPNNDHARLLIIHGAVITGAWLVVALYRKLFLGTEDVPGWRPGDPDRRTSPSQSPDAGPPPPDSAVGPGSASGTNGERV